MLTIEAARLAARQEDSAGVTEDLLFVPGVKIRGQPVRGPGPGVGFPSHVQAVPIITRVKFFELGVHRM